MAARQSRGTSCQSFQRIEANSALADQIFCLPVPEKTKRQHNFVVIPTSPITEPIIWTVFEPTKKELDAGANEEPTYTAGALNKELKSFNKKVVFPNEDQFASAIVQSHRKNEKAFHVKAHRGAKDGASNHYIPIRGNR